MRRSASTISDELERNKVKGRYDPIKAQHKAYVRRKYSKYQGMKIVKHIKLQQAVDDWLWDGQSPEAIAGRLKKHEPHLPNVSGDSIRRYIKSVYGRKIEYRREKWQQKRRRKGSRKKAFWQNRKMIGERPEAVNRRQRVGDAEGDFIVSGKSGRGILLVVVDRKERASFLERILNPTTGAVTRACRRIKQRYPEWRTMTTDNDILMQHHEELEQKLGITIYFCNPYSSWEKGTVENTNRQVRKDIPKGSDISRYSPYIIKKIEARLNRRIMECLDFYTPAERLALYRKRKKRRQGR